MKHPDYSSYDYLEDMRQIAIRYLSINDEIHRMPEGSLVMHRHKSGVLQAYNHIWNGGQQKSVFLNPRRQEAKALIDALSEKKASFERLKSERAELEGILRKNGKTILTLLAELIMPTAQPGFSFPVILSENTKYPHGLIYETDHGELVRSMAEASEANWFFGHGIAYRYEMALRLNGENVFPDFCFINPLSGRQAIHEHLGENELKYWRHWYFKLGGYVEIGYMPGRDIFTTKGEDVRALCKAMEQLYTPKRYDILRTVLETGRGCRLTNPVPQTIIKL